MNVDVPVSSPALFPTLSDAQRRDLVTGPADVEWRYEMRWRCQEILPGLFLGPLMASKDRDTLKRLGVTHIACIRDAKEAFSVKPRFPDDFNYITFDVEDNEDQNLIRIFPRAKNFIDNAIQGGGKVLVHCNGGISLSPAFTIMYVMQACHLSWEDALHMVQNRRYCISPNGGFLVQLKEYEAIYQAAAAVATHNQQFPPIQQPDLLLAAQRIPSIGQRRKRDDEDDDDEIERSENYKRSLKGADDDFSAPAPRHAQADPDAMEM